MVKLTEIFVIREAKGSYVEQEISREAAEQEFPEAFEWGIPESRPGGKWYIRSGTYAPHQYSEYIELVYKVGNEEAVWYPGNENYWAEWAPKKDYPRKPGSN